MRGGIIRDIIFHVVSLALTYHGYVFGKCEFSYYSLTLFFISDYNEFSKTSFDAMVISIDNNLVK